MGNNGSTERKAEIRAQHEKNLEENKQKARASGDQKIRDDNLSTKRRTENERSQMEKEVKLKMEQELKEIDQKIEEASKSLQDEEEKFAAWIKIRHEEGSREEEKLNEAGREDLALRKREYDAERRKLEEQKSILREERKDILAIAEKAEYERKAMRESHDETTSRKDEDHKKYILDSRTETYNAVNGLQADQRRIVEQGRSDLQSISKRGVDLHQLTLNDINTLDDKMDGEMKHDEFRVKCKYLLELNNKFVKAFNNQTTLMKTTILHMARRKQLVSLPETKFVDEARKKLNNEVMQFTLPEEFFSSLEQPLQQCKVLIKNIESDIFEIEYSISEYQEEWEKDSSENNPELKTAQKNAKEHFKKVSDSVEELNTVMQENFMIAASNQVQKQINANMAALCNASRKPILGVTSGITLQELKE